MPERVTSNKSRRCFDEAGGLYPSVASFSHELPADMFSPAGRVLFRYSKSETAHLTWFFIYFKEAGGLLPSVSSFSRNTDADELLLSAVEKKSFRSTGSEHTVFFKFFVSLDGANGSFPFVLSFLPCIDACRLLSASKHPFRTPEHITTGETLIYFNEAGGSFPSVSLFSDAAVHVTHRMDITRHAAKYRQRNFSTRMTQIVMIHTDPVRSRVNHANPRHPCAENMNVITAGGSLPAYNEKSSLRSPMPEPATISGTYIYPDEADGLSPSASFLSIKFNSIVFLSPDGEKVPFRRTFSTKAIFIFTHNYCGGADGSLPFVSSFSHDITSGNFWSSDWKKSPFRRLTPELATLSNYYIYFDEAGGSFPSVSSFSHDIASDGFSSPALKKSPFRRLTPESATLSKLYICFDEAGGSLPSVSSFSGETGIHRN